MTTRSETPHDQQAPTASVSADVNTEWAIAGAALEWPQVLSDVDVDLTPEDFFVSEAAAVFAAAKAVWTVHRTTRIGKVDDLLVANQLVESHPTPGIEAWKHQIVTAKMAAVHPRREHVDIVLRWARSRALAAECQAASGALARSGNPTVVADRLIEQVGRILDRDRFTFPDVVPFDDVLASPDAETTWAVPGIIHHHGRGIIVAAEGSGKSTLLRQIALCAAQGIHPFTLERIRPIRTLIIDCENSAAVIAHTGQPLVLTLRSLVKDRYDPSRCQVLRLDGAVDVRDPTYRRRILSRIQAVEPELVILGPLYKIARSRPHETYEDAADDTQEAIRELMTRAKRPFGLLLEHHAPKRQGLSKRELAPFGSQRWLAWPDFGFGLEEGDRIMVGAQESVSYTRTIWRGARVPLAWPDQLIRSAKSGKTMSSGMLWDARWDTDGGAHNALLKDPSVSASSNGHVPDVDLPPADPDRPYADF